MKKIILIILTTFILGILISLLVYPKITHTYIVNYTNNTTKQEGVCVINCLQPYSVNKIEKKIERSLNNDITVNKISQ